MPVPTTLLQLTLYIAVGHLTSTCYGQLDPNTTVTSTTPSTTTLPPNPGKVMFIIIPVGILVGIPVAISMFCCLKAMFACCKRKKDAHTSSRRVTPINDPDAWDTKVHDATISQDQMFSYDGKYAGSGDGGGGYAVQPQYGWDF